MLQWRTAVNTYHTLFNIKFALISAVANGLIAMYVNWKYGLHEAGAAGLTQALASFLSTGFTARVVQHFSPIQNRFHSYFWGSLVPATLTLAISILGHFLNQTPELFRSCIAPVAISYTTSYMTNWITRRGYMLPGNYHRRSP